MRARAVGLGLVLAVVAAVPASAEVTVTSAADSGPGTIRNILATAVDGLDIVVPDPMTLADPKPSYVLTSGPLVISKGVYLHARASARAVTIDAGGGSRVFTVTSPFFDNDPTVAGVTLTGGTGTGNGVSGHGGAVLVRPGAFLHLRDAIVKGNTATATGSAAASGGGMAVEAGGRGWVGYSQISDNTVTTGTGLGVGGGLAVLGTSTATDAPSSPGLFVDQSTVARNRLTSTGAATLYGGGVGVQGGRMLQVLHGTIADNTVTTAGHGGLARGGNLGSGTVGGTSPTGKAAASIISRGTADSAGTGDCGGVLTLTSAGDNLITSRNAQCPADPAKGDLTAAAGFEGVLRDNGGSSDTIALGPDSPAIDAADPIDTGNCLFGVDQRGYGLAYFLEGNCDIGAWEAFTRLRGLTETGDGGVPRITARVASDGQPGTVRIEYRYDGGAKQTIDQPFGSDYGERDVSVVLPTVTKTTRVDYTLTITTKVMRWGPGEESFDVVIPKPVESGFVPNAPSPAPTATPDPGPPATSTFSKVKLSRLKFRASGDPSLSFVLDGAPGVSVAVRLDRLLTGRKRGARCVKPPRRGRYKKCTRVVRKDIGRATTGADGSVKRFLSTLVDIPSSAGRYRLTLTVPGGLPKTPAKTIEFRVL